MEKIIIKEPCHVSWNEMPGNEKGKHCSVCQTTVIDFTNMALEEINLYFKNHSSQKICGKYHNRHLPTTNKWYGFLNKIECNFSVTRYKRFSLGLIYVLLFLTGCKTKRHVNTTTVGERFLSKVGNKQHAVTVNARQIGVGKDKSY